MTKKYRAEVKQVKVKKLEKDTAKLQAGTPIIEVSWLAYEENIYDTWQAIPEGTSVWLNKGYFCSPIPSPGKEKSTLQITKERLKQDFDFEGNAADISSIEGHKNEIVAEEDGNGYMRVLFVNSVDGKRKSTREVVPEADKESFSAIFDKE